VPDADLHSVGPENFEWIVDQVAKMAIAKARRAPKPPDLHCAAFFGSPKAAAKPKKAPAAKKPAGKRSGGKVMTG